MTLYLCDACGIEFPAGARGSVFLVTPDGMTDHLCCGACLRAYSNGMPVARSGFPRWWVAMLVATVTMHGIIAYLFHS